MEGKFIMRKNLLSHSKIKLWLRYSSFACVILAVLVSPALPQSREYVDVKAPITKKYVIAVPALQGLADCGPELGTTLAAQANQDLKVSGILRFDPAVSDSTPSDLALHCKMSSLAVVDLSAGRWRLAIAGSAVELDLKLMIHNRSDVIGQRYRAGPNDGRRMMTYLSMKSPPPY
jgi:hypothetical protein